MLRLLPLPLLVSLVLAQAPPVPPVPGNPGAPNPAVPGANPAVPGRAAAPVERPDPGGKPQPGVPLGETKITEGVEMTPCNGADLAYYYRKYTGRRVIVTSTAAAKEFALFLDASPDDPLTYAQAAELLRKAAGVEGFYFTPDDTDPNLEYLGGEPVKAKPPGTYNEGDPLPDTDVIITYVMTFKNIKPETAAQAFQSIMGQFSTAPVTTTNSQVIITEHTSLIRSLIKLKEEIDIAGDIPRSRFIDVKYADVTELATVINDLLSGQQESQKSTVTTRPGGAPPQNAAGGQAAPAQQMQIAGGGSATNEAPPVQVIPEPRTNRIFAMGRPVDLIFVEGLIREFDIETSAKTFLRRKLRFLAVAEFLPIAEEALNLAFTGTGEGSSSGGAAGGAPGGVNSRTSSSSRQSGTGSSRGSSSNNRSGSYGQGNTAFGQGGMNNSFGGMSGGGMGGGASLNAPEMSTAPEARRVGRTLLVADNITNSIVVNGPPSGLEIVERLLDQIDVKADQVMISTVIGQLTLSNNMEYGVDAITVGADFAASSGPLGILPFKNNITSGGSGTTPGSIISSLAPFDASRIGGTGLRMYGKLGNELEVYMKALMSNDNFTVLARPSIFTANNQMGTITSGESIAIPTNSNSFYQGGGSTNVQYQDVVLKLEVIPLINDKDTITLQIVLVNDEVSGTQTVAGAGPNGGNLTVPKITKREVVTTVTVPNNETIVLGGLITKRTGEGVEGIPILSSIPVLGKLFSNTETKDERSELLVFIQPSIVRDRASLDSAQLDADNRYKAATQTRGFADGPGVLPPVDAAPVVADKSGRRPAPAAVPKAPPAGNGMKKSIRPSQVR